MKSWGIHAYKNGKYIGYISVMARDYDTAKSLGIDHFGDGVDLQINER